MDREAPATPANLAGRRHLASYALAALGPIASAGAQFLLSFQLLHATDLVAFGSFSVLLVASQLSLGISGAMLCAPYPVLLGKHSDAPDAINRTLFTANFCLAVLVGIVLALIGLALGLGGVPSALFAVYSSLMILRWFGRAHGYVHGNARRVALSDIAYGICLVLCMIVMQVLDAVTLMAAFLSLLLSALVGLVTFGRDFLTHQFGRLSASAVLAYRHVWRDYARWSLLGVITTEGTANAHAYIVTLFGGPAAFAPIAATALLIRPVTLAMNAITDFERPQLARLFEAPDSRNRVIGSIRMFRWVLVSVWLLSLLATIVVLAWQPRLLFPEEYSLDVIWAGALLWLVIALIRILRMPESVVLQARGKFQTLAFASVTSCVVSIAMVGAMVAGGQLLWSLVGIIVGEFIFAIGIHRRARQELRQSDTLVQQRSNS